MIETIILNYLRNYFANTNVKVYTERPANATMPFILIEKTGGNVINKIHNATMAIQSYDSTLANAASLNDSVTRAMLKMPNSIDAVVNVGLNSSYNFTDTSTKERRYQSIFVVDFYLDY